jgi:hypothetical protein
MAIHRLSISVTPEVEQSIKDAAAAAGIPVSTWLSRAAIHTAKLEAGRAAVREYEAEHGAISSHERNKARKVLANAGLLDDVIAAS